MGIIIVIGTFVIRSFYLCKKQKNVLGYLVSLSVLLNFSIQIVIYVISNLGFYMALSPLSFPLLSYGGRYLIINMFLIGLLLSVFRTGEYVREPNVKLTINRPFLQYENGTIRINIK